jgi:phosphatidylserine/phosphatidylglycerophosphate/cardiolipin synthase-like enzyme
MRETAMPDYRFTRTKPTSIFLNYLVVAAVCFILAGCSGSMLPGISNTPQCQSNCTAGSGVQGVQVFVEPDDGEQVITNAIRNAQKSIWLEIYILSDRNVIRTLEEASNRGLDVRVMLEPRPFGGGTSPSKTVDILAAAGIKAQFTNPSFSLTHEKGMIIDGTTAYIMTSNFSRSALGGSSGSSGYRNREYGIIDTNTQDVQATADIFIADWNHSTPQFYDPNLVVSPINSRNDFTTLINSAHSTLLIEAEEMNDSNIEQALANVAQHGVQVEVILPSASSSSGDSNSQGIVTVKQAGVQVREDPQLYMHAKIIVVDSRVAFVGSENISTQSLDQNRELGIIVSDASVLNKLQTTFQNDWGVSQNV